MNKKKIESTPEKPVYEFLSDYQARFFYLESIKDIEEIENLLSISFPFYTYPESEKHINHYIEKYCDFELFGTGWYIYWEEPGGDWPDDLYLMNWNNYINKKIKEVQDYMNNMQSILDEKSKELQKEGNI